MKIYLACPYSDDKFLVEGFRFEQVSKKAALLIKEGFLVFSPITNSHVLARYVKLPTNWEYWAEFDKSMIDWADQVWVLKLTGWEESKGVREEVKYAEETGKLVKYIDM